MSVKNSREKSKIGVCDFLLHADETELSCLSDLYSAPLSYISYINLGKFIRQMCKNKKSQHVERIEAVPLLQQKLQDLRFASRSRHIWAMSLSSELRLLFTESLNWNFCQGFQWKSFLWQFGFQRLRLGMLIPATVAWQKLETENPPSLAIWMTLVDADVTKNAP